MCATNSANTWDTLRLAPTKFGLCCSLMHAWSLHGNRSRLCAASKCCICLIISMRCPVKQSIKGLLSVKTNHKPAGSSLSKQHLRSNSKHNASLSRDMTPTAVHHYAIVTIQFHLYTCSSSPQIRLFGPSWWHLQGAACLLECLLQAPSQKTALHTGRERLVWDHYSVRYGLHNSRHHTFENVKTALHFKMHPFHGKNSTSRMREAWKSDGLTFICSRCQQCCSAHWPVLTEYYVRVV